MSLFSRFISVFVPLMLVQSPPAFGSPKLVVLVSVDQLRPDRLSSELNGGLGRLMREGRVYTNARLDHGVLPLPEWLVETGEMRCPVDGGRIDIQKVVLAVVSGFHSAF